VTDDLERIAEIGRRMKLERVRTYGGGRVEELADMPALVIAERDGRQVAVATADLREKDAARMCGYYVAACLRPTVVYLVADSRMQMLPKDARPGPHGELQEKWNAGQRAGITEVLTITQFPKGGPVTCRYYPYKRTGKKLRWLEAFTLDEGTRVEGALIDYVAAGFEDDRYRQLFEEFVDGEVASDYERAAYLAAVDRAACRFLSTQSFVWGVRLVEDNGFPVNILYRDGAETRQ
jgi:hypothetical protein